MRQNRMFFVTIVLSGLIAIGFSGCTVIFQKGRRADVERISKLKSDLTELERAKQELESRLKNEINDKEVKVEMLARGLVITFVAEVLFDSGKAQLRKASFPKLDKVAGVLNTTVADLNVGVEGYTDNEPIRKSGWKSNWELSSARALSVLHYLSQKNVSEPRLAAIGYGEFKPVALNTTKEGRQKNRRVEIVILPKTEKTKSEE
ncbi:MAG: OmpA family protein [Candidatus Omnitrophota bacterium]|nr:OmpA family protein [Candidatus Omnitrophota bacterium]